MGWLSSIFGEKSKVSQDKTYLVEALRDSEDPMLNEDEANEVVAEFKKKGSNGPFWRFLRQYKEQLRKATVRPASCCGGLADDAGVDPAVVADVIEAASTVIFSRQQEESRNYTPVSQPEPPSQTSSWNSDPSPPSETSSWSSDSSSDSGSSGGDSGGGGDGGGGGGD